MKKSLLTILGASMLASFSYAQDVDTTIDVAWWDTLNTQFCVKVDPTYRVSGLKDLTAVGTNWKASQDKAASNELTLAGGKLTIVHKRLTSDANYTDITLVTTEWVGGKGIKFGPKADTVAGMFVNMDGDVVVQATIQTDVACNVRLDIADINGHNGNSGTTRYQVEAGAAKNYKFDFADPNTNPYGGRLFDFYSGDFYGVSNGRYGTSQLKAAVEGKDSVVIDYDAQEFIPCRTDAINRISFTIDDAADKGDIGVPVTVVISNLTIGNADKATSFVTYSQENVDAGKISFNPTKIFIADYTKDFPVSVKGLNASALEVYPNPAKGQITVNENVTVFTGLGVATGVAGTGVLDISSLVAGTYNVVGATGTTTLVVE